MTVSNRAQLISQLSTIGAILAGCYYKDSFFGGVNSDAQVHIDLLVVV